MIGAVLRKIIGNKNERGLKKLHPLVQEINGLEQKMRGLKDEELRALTPVFKERIEKGEDIDSVLPEAFAVVREVACRVLNMRPFDVQILGGIVLHKGKIAEMKTGEGKTLAATLPLYLNALTGKGAHLVTVNDYLAKRDARWMAPVYHFLGLSTGIIQHDASYIYDPDYVASDERLSHLRPCTRQEAYSADITYGTNNEFGFDVLRDNMKFDLSNYVQRDLHYAIVDEVDSILIDEARTPLIISGPTEDSTDKYYKIDKIIPRLQREREIRRQLKEGDDYFTDKKEQKIVLTEEGLKNVNSFLTTEYNKPSNRDMLQLKEEIDYKIQINGKKKHKNSKKVELTEDGIEKINKALYADYQIDEKARSSILTEEGVSKVESLLDIDNLYEPGNIETLHHVNQALKAHSLFQRDVDYVVKDGGVIIVDEFTGRLMPGRRYSDGLHQALEAKEGVKIENENQTLASVTFQNYFRMYEKLAGMTGTADTEALEFHEIYKLEVVVMPTNMPMIRKDFPDSIYKTEKEKFNAVVREIEELSKVGRPVLVGTISIEKSERLSKLLKKRGVDHHVLNAKHHEREAEIVAQAGRLGAVTLSTNMAGRGTDIVLGGNPEFMLTTRVRKDENPDAYRHAFEAAEAICKKEKEKVLELGGLHIIGTERHESRRIDNQLRGRSGRQGDPGSSRFYLSLEDDLMRIFGSDRISSIMDKLGMEEDQPIEHKLVSKAIEGAQRKVEGHNFDIRKHLLEYDDVMNQQRTAIYSLRRQILSQDGLRDMVGEFIEEVAEDIGDQHIEDKSHPEEWNIKSIEDAVFKSFSLHLNLSPEELEGLNKAGLLELMIEKAKERYKTREAEIGDEILSRLERLIMLQAIDALWKDHLLAMDHLKEGIGWRGYGQKNPLEEYKKEGFELYADMIFRMKEETVERLCKVQVARQEDVEKLSEQRTQRFVLSRGEGPAGEKPQPLKREGKKVGRNDPCPCGSGKKHKKCCGK